MEKMFKVNDKRVVLVMEHSKIGYGYPRVFIEIIPKQEYVNLDVCVGVPFGMKQESFEDWAADATPLEDEEEIAKECLDHGVSYDAIKKLLTGELA